MTNEHITLVLGGAFAEVAIANGVRRLVLLSGRGEEGAQRGEHAVRAATPDATILRASWFCQNFSEGFMLDQVLAGEVALPVADMPEPFIDIDDIADAAVAALIGDAHAGQLYEMTGPRLLTFADAIAEIGKATGRDVRFVPITIVEYERMLAEYGAPDGHALSEDTGPCSGSCSPRYSTAGTRG
jgi:uncharacterized protein YbjT (DUF2867 family)